MIKKFPIIQADVFYKSNIGTTEQRNGLITEAWDQFHNNPKTLAFTNKGCWRSNFTYKNIDWLLDEVRSLVAEAGFQPMSPTDPSVVGYPEYPKSSKLSAHR